MFFDFRKSGLSISEILGLGFEKVTILLSRYELEQRSHRIEQVKKYAEKLQLSVDYLLGDTESEAEFNTICADKERKPFYKIFLDVTTEMGLDIPAIVRITGLTDKQVHMIIIRQMKYAPLPIALQLSDTLNVPLTNTISVRRHIKIQK